MFWEQVRIEYPNKWVLFEAVDAYSSNGERIINDIAVFDIFENGNDAMEKYIKLHRQDPDKELFIFSTNKEKLEFKERRWLGVRRT